MRPSPHVNFRRFEGHLVDGVSRECQRRAQSQQHVLDAHQLLALESVPAPYSKEGAQCGSIASAKCGGQAERCLELLCATLLHGV